MFVFILPPLRWRLLFPGRNKEEEEGEKEEEEEEEGGRFSQ
jgi:hypothetical protein